MILRLLALLLLLAAVPGSAQNTAGLYVDVYRDEAVLFQVRRDKLAQTGEGAYRVWLRWLWSTPQPWKSQEETATMRFVDLDCRALRVRELAVLHKNAKGEIFDSEEFEPETAPWRTFERRSGAGAALARLCDFLPQLLEAKREAERRKE